MWKALGIFLKNRLNLSSSFLTDIGRVSVMRVVGSKVNHKVIAVFGSIEIRDAVRRAARELAGAADAGIRLEISLYSQPSLKALEAVSYGLKQKNPGVKRSIKFNDQEMDLVLDFNVDPDGVEVWRRVSASQAKVMKPKISKNKASGLTDDELTGMMDLS